MGMPVGRTIPAFLDEFAAKFPDKQALVDGDRSFSFRTLSDRVQHLACSLLALGVKKGDKVAILMGNRAEWILMDFAVTTIGAVMVGVNTWSTTRELEYVLSHSDTTVLITVDRFLRSNFLAQLDELRPWSKTLPLLRHIIVVGDDSRPDMKSFAAFDAMGAGVSPDAIRATDVVPEDLAYILYTSGSTARPKGVMILHRGLIENLYNIGERLGFDQNDRLWLAISLFWGLGCENALFAALTHGSCVVLQEPFDAGEALRIMEKERCTALYATPNMIQALIEHPDFARRDIATMRKGATIGAPDQMLRVMRDLIPHACQIFGLTETYGNCAVGDWRDPDDLRARTTGRVMPGTEFRIVDPQTEAVLTNGLTGELRVKGYVTPGYYKDPERTADSFDADGFFRTGDYCQIDADGNLTFRGRLKEMLKTGGINVTPMEVEEILMLHPGVDQAHVIGLPDTERDEIVAAVVVRRPGAGVSEQELLAHCRKEMAVYKVPRRLIFVDTTDLPLTVTGKLQKNRLNTLFPPG
jgi:fatty-acyl-CoA synthase